MSAAPDLERRYAALRAKKAAAAGADAATTAPAKPAITTASSASSASTGLPLIAPLHGLPSLSPSLSHGRPSSASSVSSKPLITITPRSLAQPPSAASSQSASLAANKRQKTTTGPIVINTPSPYGDQSDTIKRKKRPNAAQLSSTAANANASSISTSAATHSASHSSTTSQQPTIRIVPLATATPTAGAARVPRKDSASNSATDTESVARSDIDLSSTSHLASYTPVVPALSNDTLHVSNLPEQVTEQQLHALFGPFGMIQSITLLSARSPPLAFVHFTFPFAAQQALTALHDRPAPSLSPQPLHVSFARKKDAGGRGGGGGGGGGSNPVSTYEALERELVGGSVKAGGGSGDADDGDSFDVTLLAWKPEVAKMTGLTAERAVKVRRRCTRFGESMREATEGMYVLPTEEDAVQPDRDAIDYDDLSQPYS